MNLDTKLTKACTVDDAIRHLRIPDDAAPWILQSANYDPHFQRRFAFGLTNVVPTQLAQFLLMRGVGYLLEHGPCAYLLEEAGDDDDDDDDEDDDDADDGTAEDADEPGDDDRRPRQRPARRRR